MFENVDRRRTDGRNMSSIGPVVSEEKMFENVDRRQTDGRTTESLVYY